MNKIKVKYCGLKRLEDVYAAIEAKVDAIGLVFVKKSPRYVSIETAKKLTKVAKDAGVSVVALFADQSKPEVEQVIQSIRPDVLQFHGNESAAYCEQFGQAYWKAIPMLVTEDYEVYMGKYLTAEAFILDSFGGCQTGGSGQVFNWFKFPERLVPKLILAGGIHIDNVINAISETGTQFIDTSSGIESEPGVKSKVKMLDLMVKIRVFSESSKK